MLPFLINLDELPWQPSGRGTFRSDDKWVSDSLNAQKLSYIVTRLEPGMRSCPFHFHHAIEELFFVLEGTGRLRYGDEERRLRPGDFISCPPGPESAHQLINDGSEPLVYLAISTQEPLEVCEYPDSGKILMSTKDAEGQRKSHIFQKDATVDYYEGEAVD